MEDSQRRGLILGINTVPIGDQENVILAPFVGIFFAGGGSDRGDPLVQLIGNFLLIGFVITPS